MSLNRGICVSSRASRCVVACRRMVRSGRGDAPARLVRAGASCSRRSGSCAPSQTARLTLDRAERGTVAYAAGGDVLAAVAVAVHDGASFRVRLEGGLPAVGARLELLTRARCEVRGEVGGVAVVAGCVAVLAVLALRSAVVVVAVVVGAGGLGFVATGLGAVLVTRGEGAAALAIGSGGVLVRRHVHIKSHSGTHVHTISRGIL